MATQPIFEERKFYGETPYYKQTEVECRINAPSEIKNVLAVTGSATPIAEEIVDGDLRINARALFNVLYEDADGAIVKAECGVEFSGKIEVSALDKSVKFASFNVSSAEARQNNGGYTVYAVVDCAIICSRENSYNLLVSGEDIIFDEKEQEVNSLVEYSRSTLEVDGEFELSYAVKDVLSHTSTVCITEVQSGLGVIILDGNVFLSFTALQNKEKNVIVKERRNIPFRLELSVSEASPSMNAYALANVIKSNIKVVVDEDKGSSSVVASFDLDAYGCVFEKRYEKFVQDAYSVKNYVSVCKDRAIEKSISSQYVVSERVLGVTDFCPEENSEVVAVIGEKVESVAVNSVGNALNGILSATVVLKRADGSLYSSVALLAFETPFSAKDGVEYRFYSAIENFSYRVRASVEFEASIKFFTTELSEAQYAIVTDLAVGELKIENTNAISIYIARGNDTLWDVCKELGMTAEKITELNPDVEFPLCGTERIIVYRNL